MGNTIRAEVSEKNPYWIEKHRHYELKHFCLQYPIWKKAYSSLNGMLGRSDALGAFGRTRRTSNPTERIALLKQYYSTHMEMVERVAKKTDSELAEYILKGVTEGWSYDILKARMNIPCCKDVYYAAYRKFFWLLSKERD